MPRQSYTVTFPDGHEQVFTGPVGMSDDDLIQRAQQERKFAGGDIATTKAGGATRHLLEDEPGAVNAMLGGLASMTGAAPLVAAVPTVTTGLKHLSQFLATGHTDAPSGQELALDVAGGALAGYGGPALAGAAKWAGATKAGAQALRAAGENAAVKKVTDLAGADVAELVRGLLRPRSIKGRVLDAVTSKPVLRAAERVGEQFSPTGVQSAWRNVARGLTPGLEEDAAVPVTRSLREQADHYRAVRAAREAYNAEQSPYQFDRYMPNKSGYDPAAPGGLPPPTVPRSNTIPPEGFDRYAPNISARAPKTSVYGQPMAPEAEVFGEAALPMETFDSGVDRYMRNKSGYDPAAPGGLPPPDVPPSGAVPPEGFDRYMPNLSSADPAGGFGEAALPIETFKTPDALARLRAEAGGPPVPKPAPAPSSIEALKRAGQLTDSAGRPMGGATAAARPGADLEVIDAIGPNASGESAASAEALSRQSGMQARGERYAVVDRAGRSRPLIGPDAVDYVPRPGETFGIEGPTGFRTLTDNGGRVPAARTPIADFSPEARAARAGSAPAAADVTDLGEISDEGLSPSIAALRRAMGALKRAGLADDVGADVAAAGPAPRSAPSAQFAEWTPAARAARAAARAPAADLSPEVQAAREAALAELMQTGSFSRLPK